MKKNEKKSIFILILIAAVILLLIFMVTRNKNKGKLNEQTASYQSQSQTQSSGKIATENNEDQLIVEEPKREKDTTLIQKKEDGSEINTSEVVKEEKNVNGYKLSDITLTKTYYGTTIMEAKVTNETGSNQKAVNIDIVLYDRQGNEIGRIPGFIMATSAGQTVTIKNEITDDFVDAYEMKIEVKK